MAVLEGLSCTTQAKEESIQNMICRIDIPGSHLIVGALSTSRQRFNNPSSRFVAEPTMYSTTVDPALTQ